MPSVYQDAPRAARYDRTDPVDVADVGPVPEHAVTADLARRASAAGALDFESVADAGVAIRLRRNDETIDVADLERFLEAPRLARGGAVHVDPSGFAEYTKRLTNDHTTVWADADRHRIDAVFNDHAGPELPGWRDHTATLRAQLDDDWTAWADRSGKLGSQEAFAEFLEEHYPAIDGDKGPSAADMLEVASTFQARRSASFERATRLQSGDVQLKWNETTTATAGTKGTVEVPTQFVVRLRPYRGVDPVRVVCLLRYRIRDGSLAIGYQMQRRDEVLRAAFDALADTVATGLGGAAPMYRGTAPNTLR
jgi:uncharacterized protein YfdQ (DUF2303 family)